MVLTNLLRTRFERKNKIAALFAIIALEVVLGVHLWERSKPGAILGFLIKDGSQFTVAWKDPVTGYTSRSLGTIDEALKFAREELKLSEGTNPILEHELEHVWLQDRFGNYLVMWKTSYVPYLHQITFNRRSDALHFARAFRHGSYSPSPFGHSILLMPTRAE